jgi:hypothetical protein
MSKARSVDDFLDHLSHKRIGEIRALRQIIVEAFPAVTEQLKWNAPSFCWEGQDRITMRLHPGDRLELVFHRGAKVRDNADFAFIDRTGKIEWAAPDRGILSITDLLKQRGEIVELVADWILATRANLTE